MGTWAFFSPLENKVIKAIKASRKEIRLSDLTEKVYERKPKMNESITVGNAVSRINKKCKLYDLKWAIGGEGLGRGGKVVWIEKHK